MKRKPNAAFGCSHTGIRKLFLFVVYVVLLACPMVTRAETPASAEPCCQDLASRGRQALERGQSDSALHLFMSAHRMGMSLDSLYYFLAETALRKHAFDTALVFNLTIQTPKTGSFRDTILAQRYRVYSLAGLKTEANRLRDSMGLSPYSEPAPRRKPEWNLALGSGFGEEDYYGARLYPYGLNLGGFGSQGWQVRNQGQLIHPLPSPGSFPLSAGLGYDLNKSYYKDSLDYRVRLQLRAEEALGGFGFTVSGQVGEVTGTGVVGSGKVGASLLQVQGGVITFVDVGFETEWAEGGEWRFDAAWLSLYRDWGLAGGCRTSLSLSVSGVRMDPLDGAFPDKLLYVDDVTKEQPTHYQDASFQDTLVYTRFNKFSEYTRTPGQVDFPTRSSQSFVALLPVLGFSFPLPWNLSAEASGGFSLSVFPEPYAWIVAPPIPSETPENPEFRGFALNRADGRQYAMAIKVESGGHSEFYSSEPVRTVKKKRVDRQAHASFGLKRRLGLLGILVLDGTVKKYGSNISGESPIWIPSWEYGLSFRWSRSWKSP